MATSESLSKPLADLLASIESAHIARAHERGFASWEDMDAADAESDASTSTNRVEKALEPIRNRLTPAVYAALIDDTLDETRAIGSTRRWLESDRPVLILSGGTGVGKTVAAAHAMARAVRSQFVRAVQVGAHWERWSSDRESNIAPLDLAVPLLVIDDLGQESLEDRRTICALEEIFDARKTPRTRTIVTTNLDKKGIESRYRSERINSRLSECATIAMLQGDDMRRRR